MRMRVTDHCRSYEAVPVINSLERQNREDQNDKSWLRNPTTVSVTSEKGQT